MKGLRYLLPLVFACGLISSQAFSLAHPLGERDLVAVKDFVKTKRIMTLEEKAGCMMISGDLRAEYQYLAETQNGVDLRGGGAQHLANDCFPYDEALSATSGGLDQNGKTLLPVPSNEFDVELNLMFDYQGCRTWAHAHLEFDNHMGTDKRYCCGSGVCNDVCLYKAYFGYNIFEECCSRLDIEVGRRRFFHVFDSRVQFDSRFDGLLLRYSNSFDCVGDFYAQGAAFVINENIDHYGFVMETGFLDIMECGLDLKYSYIDWHRDGPACYARYQPAGMIDPQEYDFRISQFTAAYNFFPEILRCDAKVYGAFLMNHEAKSIALTNNKRENHAWYAGVMFGEICAEGDFTIDVNYQWVEAQAIPDCDVSGVGRGNVQCQNLYQNSQGNANYRAWEFAAAYALTDNLAITTEVEWSEEADRMIAGTHKYTKYELELVYAF